MKKTQDMKKYQHEYYLKNIERLREYKRAYNLARRKPKIELTEEEKELKKQEQLERRRKAVREYSHKHKDELNEYCRNRYNTNEEFRNKRKAANKKWYQSLSPERKREYIAKRTQLYREKKGITNNE